VSTGSTISSVRLPSAGQPRPSSEDDRGVLTLDTSAIVSLVDARQTFHHEVKVALEADRGPFLVPAGILSELMYILERRIDMTVADAVLADLQAGAFTLDCGEDDVPRIRELLVRYRDLELGFADASVIACAERNGGVVVTVDRRDFDVVAREGRISVLPPL